MNEATPGVALIAGASGIVGHAVEQEFCANGWSVLAAARRPLTAGHQGRFVALDFRDRAACLAADVLKPVTHLIFCGRFASPDRREEEIVNREMLLNLLDALQMHASGLKHIHLVHGTKWYGSHLGPYRTPAREDDPRHMPPNFYYAQHDLVAERQRGKGWTFTTSRPHTVCGLSSGYSHNFMLLLAAYACICRELGLPLIFPGIQACYDTVGQITDATYLARAIRWMTTAPNCANQSFNVINSDYFRWRYLWPKIAEFFGMATGPVQTMELGAVMADKAEIWDALAAKHKLTPSFSDLGAWPFLNQVLGSGKDDMSSGVKLRRYGFAEAIETEETVFGLLRAMQERRLIPH